MSYFNNFPKVFYDFGNTGETALTQNLAAYVEIIDELAKNNAFYNDYYIRQGVRPDHASYSLYGDPTLHWLFYLMNPKIREQGWPLSRLELTDKIVKDFSGTVIVSRDDDLFSKFAVGQTVTSTAGNGSGVVAHRNIGMGQIVLDEVTGTFIDGEQVQSVNSEGITEYTTPVAITPESLSTRYYLDADGERIDIAPTEEPGAQITRVTHLQYYITENEALRKIRVIRPTEINQVIRRFTQAMDS